MTLAEILIYTAMFGVVLSALTVGFVLALYKGMDR